MVVDFPEVVEVNEDVNEDIKYGRRGSMIGASVDHKSIDELVS